MRKLLLGFVLLAGFVANGQQTNHSISIGGVTRNYIQYLPTGFQESENLPVVFVLHGLGGTNTSMVGAGFNQIADTARFIVIYPNGTLNAYGQNSWNNGTLLASTANDLGFFNQLMDSMILGKNADPARVYMTGFSMGSIMSHHMACLLNHRIAAIGAMAGTMATSDISTCVPVYKTPVIHLHGDADGTVPYAGSALPSLSLVAQTMDFWKGVHGCANTYDSIRMPDNAPGDNITVDRFVYNTCDPSGSLELWRLNNADHIFLYEPVNDITESKEVWRFFLRFQHSNPASAGSNELESLVFNVFPNPSNEYITIETSENVEEFVILDLSGRIVMSAETSTLDIRQLEPGHYIVQAGQASKRIIKL